MKRIFIIVLACIMSLSFTGCGKSSEKQGAGGLLLKMSQSSGKKTLLPDISMDIVSYEITGSGPGSETFTTTITSGFQAVIDHLLPGSWTVSVNARNIDTTIIGTGSAAVTVIAGATATAEITVSPIDGDGTLDLTLQWNFTSIATPVIEAQLVPTEGSTQTLHFTVSGSGNTATHSSSVPSGYYTLVVKLLDGEALASGSVEVVRVVDSETTAGNYQFSEMDPDFGRLQVNITNEMADPIDVTMSGQSDEMSDDGTMVILGSVPPDTGNVTYVWYIDGSTVGTGDAYTVRDLIPGYYRIDVTAYSADGSRAGSASHNFSVLNSGLVAIPAPAYSIPCDEGTGTTVTDTVTGAVMTGISPSVNWCSGTIRNQTNRAFIKTGANFDGTGILEGDLIDMDLNEYTVSFMTRITDDGQGAIFNFLGSGLHFRFWNGGWDDAGGLATTSEFVQRNVWTRVTYVQNATTRYIYINRTLAAQAEETGTLPAGNVRIGAYSTSSYYYPGEYTDINIYDVALSQQQITQICNTDGNTPEFNLLSDGTDLGSIYKREEHGGVYDSTIIAESGRYRHWYNGDSCWGAIAKLIPSGFNSLWFSAEFFYPTNLSANHDFGSTAQTIGIYEDFGRSDPIAILYLNHDDTTNVLTLGNVTYRNTTDGNTTVALDGREILKDQNYQFELYYSAGTNGTVSFYLDGELLHTATANFDLAVQQAMYGLNLGIHPQIPGDVIYSDNVFVGVKRLSEYQSE